jgi:choline dehydrogenase
MSGDSFHLLHKSGTQTVGAEDANVKVLLLEAGGTDDVPGVMDAASWRINIGSERDWSFSTQPSQYLNGRSLGWSMGKVLGGGSSINVMIWSRGHKNDWDYFAKEAGDPAWNYESVLAIYRRIEDWHGEPDPARRAGHILCRSILGWLHHQYARI